MTDTDQQVVPQFQVGSKLYVTRDGDSRLGDRVVVTEVIVGGMLPRYKVRLTDDLLAWENTYVESSLSPVAIGVIELEVTAHAKVRVKLSDSDMREAVLATDKERWLDEYADDTGLDQHSFEIQEALWEDADFGRAKLIVPDVLPIERDPNQSELAL